MGPEILVRERRIALPESGEVVLFGGRKNDYLDDEAITFLRSYDELFNDVIQLGDEAWKPREAAYKKMELGRVSVVGLKKEIEPFELQMAKIYVDSDIPVPGVPRHNHPEYSEYFGVPSRGGYGVLSLGLEEDGTDAHEIVLMDRRFAFIPGTAYHALRPFKEDGVVYVAVLRFGNELLEEFKEGHYLERLD